MKTEDTKILFMGTSFFAKEILASLWEEKYNIVAVFTQPDKKSGRSREIKAIPVKEFAELKKIAVSQPPKFDSEIAEKIKEMDPDLIIVAAYGRIIPLEILEIPEFKSINVHPSLLPKYRGPSPIQNAVLNGEKETGTTIMLMDNKMDHGSILAQEKVNIAANESAEALTQKLANISSELLLKTIPLWIEKKIKPQEQDESKATYCQLIEREDGHIFWDSEAEEIYNKFRAFYPWPGIFCLWENNGNLIRLKLNKIGLEETENNSGRQIGEVFESGGNIGVQTAKGIIILEEIQPEGKRPTGVKEFINGYPNFIGGILK